jgi:periplasmic divalent cation tolerance protein
VLFDKKLGKIMELNEKFCVMCTSLPSEDIAREMARHILSEHLAFCCWIRPAHKAIYHWEGAIQEESEVELLCKTLPVKKIALHEYILSNHPYEVPYIGEFEGILKNNEYINWAKGEISF